MYALILITVLNSSVAADHLGEYATLSECFDGRDNVLVERRAWDGFLEPGVQAVCIQNGIEGLASND